MSRIVLIVNPAAGGGRAARMLGVVRGYLARQWVDARVLTSEHPGAAVELVRDLPRGEADVICGLGGDGTFHEILNGLMQRPHDDRPALALLPGGSGNSLLHDLGLLRVEAAAAVLVQGVRHPLDVLRVRLDGRELHAFNIVGLGLAGRAADRAERMRWLGASRYTIAAAIEVLVGRREGVELQLDDGEPQGTPLALACNTQHTGRGMRAAPAAELDDGLVDVVTCAPAGRLKLLQLLSQLSSGKHTESPLVTIHRAARLRIASKREEPVVVDGEMLRCRELEAEVLPGAVRLVR